MRHAHLPIVVVGGGVAGLATALSAGPASVRLLCRAHDGCGSASALAQGGIAAALDPQDTPAAHAIDTLAAGAHHNDVAMVQWLTAEASAAIAWLQAQAVAFDRDSAGDLQLGREGGHGQARIVHAGGDASGAALVLALRAQAQAAAHVQWRGGVDVDGLLMQEGRVVGVRTCDERGRHEQVEAAAVVLATGGIGALYARTSNPPGADGAGLALGLAAGAEARDLEFVQFHPTALDVPGHCLPLVTEALRGAGARLLDDHGHALMAGIHPQGDLAPRDVVSRRVAAVRAAGGRVWLDATAVAGDWEQRFPTVLATCLAHGFDPRLAALPVTPAAHFHMGGLATDADGRTSVPGLYAVGEVACNGVHGANRLASNSLLEGVVCGRRLGRLLANADAPVIRDEPMQLVERGNSLPAAQLAVLHELLWQAAGPVRESTSLRDAWRICTALAPAGWQARLAKALLRAMRLRRQSLGAHWREDRGCPH
ncbi:FAD-dependent oxidoreductase [Rhodanobacter sp. AS-Z3]|uniref:L-aspartate oxidase n=1 Tax=Rhodanobacter sp. AS-Z3 TaxID=3031330 RepID=UPI0024788CC4|nr:FAD-binding protein [Rhodanobacter sp. AS-Z3]WEN14539.1 FAD-dependent oxidoreductase [Rhodanobacter sp. AS-Z3]